MSSEWLLGCWSGVGIFWWLISWWLVARAAKDRPVATSAKQPHEWLSIFKPLPPLGESGLAALTAGLESFVSQLDERSELLLGIHEADRERTAAFVARLRKRVPAGQFTIIFRSAPDQLANPKIAWQQVLAPHARGELWLWSDADIIAPAGFIAGARAEWARSGASMLTFPYVVREMTGAPAFLDALFVNAEFHPGVLLLQRFGPVDFGLGAGTLFRREDFLREISWDEIGSALADDFVLGQRLGPVRVSGQTVVTVAEVSGWFQALLHHLRWSKTLCWNRPVGTAGRLIVLPVTGWLACVIVHPGETWAWLGLIAMTQVDVLFATVLCRLAGCRSTWRDLLTTEVWSVWRVVVWMACWLPWPVVWRGQRWWGPKLQSKKESLRRRH